MKSQIGMLPGGIDLSHSVENEYLCLKLAAAFGLPSASVAIADFRERRVLVVERFDRRWTRDQRLLRLPQEDCCQALSVPPMRKYEADGGPGIGAVLDLLRAATIRKRISGCSSPPEQDEARGRGRRQPALRPRRNRATAFVQTAPKSGMPAAAVEQICAELAERAGTAIDEVLRALPDDFPAALAESITGGMRTRLGMLDSVAA